MSRNRFDRLNRLSASARIGVRSLSGFAMLPVATLPAATNPGPFPAALCAQHIYRFAYEQAETAVRLRRRRHGVVFANGEQRWN